MLPRRDNTFNDDRGISEVWYLAFSSDRTYFAYTARRSTVYLVPWDKSKQRNLKQFENCDHGMMNKGNFNSSKFAEVLVIDTGATITSLTFGKFPPMAKVKSSCLWKFHTKHLDIIFATGHNTGRIRIWNALSGNIILELYDNTEVIRCLSFSEDGTLRLVSGSQDGILRVWDILDDGNMFKVLKHHRSIIINCTWSPNNKLLASVGENKEAKIWNMENYTLFHNLSSHYHNVIACRFSPDGALLVTASLDSRAILWDPILGQQISTFYHLNPPPATIFACGYNSAWIRGVDFSSDGCHVVTICEDHMVRCWSIFNREPKSAFHVDDDMISMACSPCGRTVAIGTRSGVVHFFDLPRFVPTLLHLCRMVICFNADQLDELDLPPNLISYLHYNDIRE